ncbi:MAG: ribonucleotide-diphosphate reductase subunit beta [Candidatus Moraniibacteriota bacterium]|nr:MAG: ribonucleotide-diphosphate reductase subunit beta [Candidatus Moranbacteria bacterium]
MQKNVIFNPKGNDDVAKRKIIKGATTGLFQLNATKYQWATSLYQVMIGNFWVPEKVSGLKDDARMFSTQLTKEEQRAYKGILSFLIFLDSVQTVNLPNFSEYITSPEVNLILSIQAYQEAIHSQSYATILETVVDSKERDEIYYFWRDDKILLERNKYIGAFYQDFIDDPSDKNFFRGIVANYILESIYFYNGFAFFDTLVDQTKMLATGRMISYIRRDELTHVTMFAHIIKEVREEFPDIYDEKVIIEMVKEAVNQEIEWGKHILGNKIPGMNAGTTVTYTQWLANQRLELLGMAPIYEGVVENPYKHLERLQDTNSDKGNFFESTVVNYTQSSSMKGNWDF